MTEGNKKENISLELKRAEEALKSAEVLFSNNLLNDAVSRLYYFVLYNVRALLLSLGIEARSHEGALRLLSLHFIKKGVFSTGISHIFSTLMKLREEADYNSSYDFASEDFVEYREKACYFADKVKSYLKDQGLLINR